jgi:hypothetical protein
VHAEASRVGAGLLLNQPSMAGATAGDAASLMQAPPQN